MTDEPTSSESHDTTKEEVLKAIPEMDPWVDMQEELKIEEVTPHVQGRRVHYSVEQRNGSYLPL